MWSGGQEMGCQDFANESIPPTNSSLSWVAQNGDLKRPAILITTPVSAVLSM